MKQKLQILILMLAVLLFLFASTQAHASDLRKIVLQLRWDHQFQFAGYYAADWKYYYREEGLEVEIRSALTREGKILSATKEVSSGKADFGIGGADILIACDQGADLRVTAVIFQNSAARLYLKQETPYSSLSDLTNLRVARKVNDLIDVEFQAMLLNEGIDPKKIFPHPHQSGMEHLLSDQVQVMPGYKTTIPYHSAKSGINLKEISPITYGIDFYGDSLFAGGSLVSRSPEIVAAFVRASLKGWEYALKHPEKIAAEISTRFERTDPVADPLAFNLFQARAVREMTLYPLVELGHINPDRWEKMHDFLKRSGLVRNETDMNLFIFDPKKIQAEKETCFLTIFRWVFALTVITAVLISAWAWSLRNSVRQRTAQLRSELALRKETEKNLRDREMLLRKISENLPRSCITVIEKDFTVSFISGREFQEHNTDSDDFAGMPISEMFGEHTRSVEQHYQKTFAGEDSTFELLISNRCYIYNTVPLFEDNGEIQRILCVAQNITERRQMENALRESEEQLKKILEILPVGVWIADKNGIITQGNPAGHEIWKGARYVGPERFHEYKAWWVKTGKRILPEEWGVARAVFNGETSAEEEIEIECFDGSRKFILNWAVPILGPEQEIEGAVSVNKDITDRKLDEERIRNQNILLEQAVADKQREMEELFEKLLRQEKLATIGKLTGSIAHELRNPLGAVRQSVYFLRTLAKQGKLEGTNPKVQEHLTLIENELETASRVIADVLELTRMKPLLACRNDLKTLMENALSLCPVPPGIQITTDLSPDPFPVWADPVQFRQVLINVFSNAVQGIKGEGQIRVQARVTAENHGAEMEISDTGIGIAPEALPKIFEPLYTTKASGTGLGLCVCKEIMEKHQGQISLHSEPEKGTVVKLFLPHPEEL